MSKKGHKEGLFLELVNKFCLSQMLSYMDCVDANPRKWDVKCKDQRQALNTCKKHHPAINSIQEECSDMYVDYQDCLQLHPKNLPKCVPLMEAFSKCAEKHYEGKDAGASETSSDKQYN